ncbi:unnamed protein product [Amoebophrya sp. A120]|nr:unnamed protein product [Amoebophrya sp. A120]|eukprot:GSA120T00001368001.1
MTATSGGDHAPLTKVEAPPPTVRVGVGCVLVNRAGHILVGKRKKSHGAGQYALPGGHLEMGEEWADCAAREVREETGLVLEPENFRFLYVSNDVYTEEKHYVTIFMLHTPKIGEDRTPQNLEPEKCEGWSWQDWQQLHERFVDEEKFLSLRQLLRFMEKEKGALDNHGA